VTNARVFDASGLASPGSGAATSTSGATRELAVQ